MSAATAKAERIRVIALHADTVEVGGVALPTALTGVTASAAELNILDGVTASTAELNILDGVTASAAELNILDGVTASAAELNILDGVTATAAELNALDGATPIVAVERTFTETTGAGTYTGAVVVPAGATLLDIIVNGVALWTATTSAALEVGDGTDPDGYYTAVDLKATDLLAGESLSFAHAGGKVGAYIADSQVSPRYAAASRTITGTVVTVGAAGDAGRTRMVVVYALPLATAAATKA
jgi:hypothetical protein